MSCGLEKAFSLLVYFASARINCGDRFESGLKSYKLLKAFPESEK